tara:strand:- start:488 stop:1111 length:624 start_codon:yes stop_codon:yes gene_type:complete
MNMSIKDNKIILKDSRASTVVQDGDIIIKTFKPGFELNINKFNKEWKDTCNQFGEIYGHFPKIIECDTNKLIIEKIEGNTIEELLVRLKDSKEIEKKFEFIKKIQYMFFKFISNLFEYNVKFNTVLIHQDLNFSNIFIHDNKLICVDLESTTVNKNLCKQSFIGLPMVLLQDLVDNINFQYYVEKEQEAIKIAKKHRQIIAMLNGYT